MSTKGGGLVDRFEHLTTHRLDFTTRRRIKKGSFYVSLLLWLIVLIFPLYWMFLSSVRPTQTLYSTQISALPKMAELTFNNYQILMQTRVGQLFFNTLIVATGVMGLTVLVSTVAGYGLTRYDFPFKFTFARMILFGYMLSPIVLAIPMYSIFRHLGLLNTYLGIILAQSTLATPFGVWLMWNMFQSVSITQEEAAWVMGSGRIRTFKDIAVPNARSGILAVALFGFAIVWNDFTFARILLPKTEAMTLSPGLMALASQGHYINQGNLMAISVVMSLLPILVAYWLQSYLLAGFQIGE